MSSFCQQEILSILISFGANSVTNKFTFLFLSSMYRVQLTLLLKAIYLRLFFIYYVSLITKADTSFCKFSKIVECKYNDFQRPIIPSRCGKVGKKNLLQRHMNNLELPCFKKAELSIPASCVRKAISNVPLNSRYYMYNEAKFSTLR